MRGVRRRCRRLYCGKLDWHERRSASGRRRGCVSGKRRWWHFASPGSWLVRGTHPRVAKGGLRPWETRDSCPESARGGAVAAMRGLAPLRRVAAHVASVGAAEGLSLGTTAEVCQDACCGGGVVVEVSRDRDRVTWLYCRDFTLRMGAGAHHQYYNEILGLACIGIVEGEKPLTVQKKRISHTLGQQLDRWTPSRYQSQVNTLFCRPGLIAPSAMNASLSPLSV